MMKYAVKRREKYRFFHQPSTEVFGEINIWNYFTCGKFEVCKDWPAAAREKSWAEELASQNGRRRIS
jgi:hypothetical protein